MHVSTKLVPATFTLIFVLAAFVTMLHRIVYILNVVNPHFSDGTPNIGGYYFYHKKLTHM